MSEETNNNIANGKIGVFEALTLIFITLKLTHVINWSWWWVLLPAWGWFLLVVFVAAIVKLAE